MKKQQLLYEIAKEFETNEQFVTQVNVTNDRIEIQFDIFGDHVSVSRFNNFAKDHLFVESLNDDDFSLDEKVVKQAELFFGLVITKFDNVTSDGLRDLIETAMFDADNRYDYEEFIDDYSDNFDLSEISESDFQKIFDEIVADQVAVVNAFASNYYYSESNEEALYEFAKDSFINLSLLENVSQDLTTWKDEDEIISDLFDQFARVIKESGYHFCYDEILIAEFDSEISTIYDDYNNDERNYYFYENFQPVYFVNPWQNEFNDFYFALVDRLEAILNNLDESATIEQAFEAIRPLLSQENESIEKGSTIVNERIEIPINLVDYMLITKNIDDFEFNYEERPYE